MVPRGTETQIADAKQALPTFNTERFVVTPLAPPKLRELAQVLLKDERLVEQLSWMQEKSAEGADREAFLLELQCAAGYHQRMGLRGARACHLHWRSLGLAYLGGIDLEVLCASQIWNHGVADEVGDPVATWLEDSVDVRIDVAH